MRSQLDNPEIRSRHTRPRGLRARSIHASRRARGRATPPRASDSARESRSRPKPARGGRGNAERTGRSIARVRRLSPSRRDVRLTASSLLSPPLASQNPNRVVGSGYIQFPPQRPFAGPLLTQPPTVSVRANESSSLAIPRADRSSASRRRRRTRVGRDARARSPPPRASRVLISRPRVARARRPRGARGGVRRARRAAPLSRAR